MHGPGAWVGLGWVRSGGLLVCRGGWGGGVIEEFRGFWRGCWSQRAVLGWEVAGVVERWSRDRICMTVGKLDGNRGIHSSSHHDDDEPCR